jgi:hypothetical protein
MRQAAGDEVAMQVGVLERWFLKIGERLDQAIDLPAAGVLTLLSSESSQQAPVLQSAEIVDAMGNRLPLSMANTPRSGCQNLVEVFPLGACRIRIVGTVEAGPHCAIEIRALFRRTVGDRPAAVALRWGKG